MYFNFVSILSLLFPWPIRRWMLQTFLGYSIHPTARIGFSLISSKTLIMEGKSYIGHLNVCKGMDLISISECSSIGNLNWITGVSTQSKKSYTHERDRLSQLIILEHSAITHRHYIDCTNSIHLGHHSIFAGVRSQILTHSINLSSSVQESKTVHVGDYCFIGTDCLILGGSVLPDYCILGAKALLNKQFSEQYCLYTGVPAVKNKQLSKDFEYFNRITGFVS